MKQIRFDDLNIYIYETLREFTDKLREDFEESDSDSFYEFYLEEHKNKNNNGFVDKEGMHLWFSDSCSDEEKIFTIGHELGHLTENKVTKDREVYANRFAWAALEAFQILNIIKQL
jgi:Zn-dependent peptidase ImmA (M78 family)